MGREIKRVPVGFPWPVKKIWWGYINPLYEYGAAKDCEACGATGYSPKAREISDKWYAFDNAELVPAETPGRQYNKNAWCYNLDADDVAALIAADRLWDFTRIPRTEEQRKIAEKKIADGGNSWLPESNGYVPTPEEVNYWARNTSGHDSLNHGIVVEAKCKRLHIRLLCPVCKGEGTVYISKEMNRVMNRWKSVEPPKGTAWQLWETVSEGSPITPAFATAEELVDYLVEHGDAWGYSWTRGQAEAMVKQQWVMSGMFAGGKYMDSREAVEYTQKEKEAKEQ